MYTNFVNPIPFKYICHLFKHFIAVVYYLKFKKAIQFVLTVFPCSILYGLGNSGRT